jgi:hypothetical protein
MGDEMNNKRNLNKSVTVILLVALASLATTGLVLADHIGTVEGAPVTSQTFFNQYQAAIEHAEEDADAASSKLWLSRVRRLTPFEQYMNEELQREKEARTNTSSVGFSKVQRLTPFEQYMNEELQREKEARTFTISE